MKNNRPIETTDRESNSIELSRLGKGITVESGFGDFPCSFSNTEYIENTLKGIQNRTKSVVLGLNGTKHTSNIVSLPCKSRILVSSGVDGLILDNSEKVSIILGVADCAGLAFSNLDGDKYGLIHAGHKGLAFDIVGKLLKQLKGNSSSDEVFNFYLSPMAGENFEFTRKAYEKQFSELFIKYGYDFDKYFTNTEEGKGFLDLRAIILDILVTNGVASENVIVSNVDTNNPNNNWPSYRLHTIFHDIIAKYKKEHKRFENRTDNVDDRKEISSLIGLTNLEKELFESPYFWSYEIDRRLHISVRN